MVSLQSLMNKHSWRFWEMDLTSFHQSCKNTAAITELLDHVFWFLCRSVHQLQSDQMKKCFSYEAAFSPFQRKQVSPPPPPPLWKLDWNKQPWWLINVGLSCNNLPGSPLLSGAAYTHKSMVPLFWSAWKNAWPNGAVGVHVHSSMLRFPERPCAFPSSCPISGQVP